MTSRRRLPPEQRARILDYLASYLGPNPPPKSGTGAAAPRTTMRTRHRLVRALITEIVADVDEAAGEIVFVIHWKGGQHSGLRVRKPPLRTLLAANKRLNTAYC
jgi:hypothetical protein